MPKPKLTLSEKIFAITQRCATIKRNGVGESSDPNRPLYPYVKIEDVLDNQDAALMVKARAFTKPSRVAASTQWF